MVIDPDPAVLSLEDLTRLGEGKTCIECEGTGWACQPPRCQHPFHVQCPWCHGDGKNTGALAAAPALLASAIHYAQEAERWRADTLGRLAAERDAAVARASELAAALDVATRTLSDANDERDCHGEVPHYACIMEALRLGTVDARERTLALHDTVREQQERAEAAESLLDRARAVMADHEGGQTLRSARKLGDYSTFSELIVALADLLTPATEEGDDGG